MARRVEIEITIKLIAIALLYTIAVFGQQRNTVYAILANNLTATGGPYAVTNNIGQAYHSFTVTITKPSTNCTTQSFQYIFSAQIESSYDNATWTAIPQQRVSYVVDSINLNIQKVYRAAGAFPYIRFRITHFPSTLANGCTVNISYTGSLSSTSLTDIQQANNYSISWTNTTLNVCTPIIQLPSEANSGVVLNAVTYAITSLSATTPVGVTIYLDSACTVGYASLTAISSFVIQPDSLNSPLIRAPLDANNNLGLYFKNLNSGGTGYITVGWNLAN